MINNIEKALSIIDANYCGKPDSLLGEINDHSFFCNDKFWELYDSILLLVKQKYYDDGITVHISLCYQRLLKEIIYVFLTIFLYLLKCPQSLILSALRAFFFCGKPHISRSIFLYFLYQTWLKSW